MLLSICKEEYAYGGKIHSVIYAKIFAENKKMVGLVFRLIQPYWLSFYIFLLHIR